MSAQTIRVQVTPGAFALYSVASVISAPLAYLKTEAPFMPVVFLGIAITAVAAGAAWLFTLVTRNITLRPWLHLLVFLSQLVAIGIIRGAAFYLFSEFLQLPLPATLGFRILNSVVVTVIWLWLACAVVSGRREYLRTYRTLVNQAVFNTARRDNGELPLSSKDLDELENIVALKANLSDIEEQLAHQEISQASLRQAAQQVREQIETTLRPMSHRLWFNATEGTPQLRARGLITDALSPLKFKLWRVMSICVVLMLVGGVAFLPLTVNLLTVIVSSVVLFAMLTLYRYGLARSPGSHTLRSVIFLLVSGLGTYGFTYLVLLALLPSATTTFSALAWIIPLAVWIVVWADSALTLLSQDRETITEALRANVRVTPDSEQERLAAYLHNSLQSELTGLAFQLEHSARTLDAQESRQSLERLGALINRSISQDFANFTETPLDRISRIQEAWLGIAQVNIDFDSTIPSEDSRLVLAVQVIEEAITNAVRHAGATFITATVRHTQQNLRIEFTSNRPVMAGVPSGVGSSWLDRYSLTSHHVTTDEQTSVLTVEL